VGAATFCALGVAVSTLIPNDDAAPAVVNGVFLAVFAAFDPRLPHGPAYGFAWSDVAVMALWGLGAGLLAVRRFRWESSR